MGSWENSAVSFLDVNEFGTSYGRAYLIKKSQLEHIHKSEGKSSNWYPDIVELEEIEGIKAYTFTNKNTKKHEPISKISGAYFSTLLEGLVEAGLSTEDAYEYLFSCASEYGETSWAGYGKYRNSHYNNHKHIAELHY